MATTTNWKKTAVATVVATVLGLASASSSWALSLGALSIQSAVGEALRAEIDFAELSDDEAASLKVELPSSDIYRAAGLEYTPSLDQLNVQLLRRDNGQRFLRLQGQQPVTGRYLDLVLQLNWSAGRIMRNYALLLPPPREAQPAAPSPTLPQGTPAAPAPQPAEPAAPATPVPATTAPTSQAAKPATTAQGIAVKYGDTAGRIALDHLPEGVSLDQMLVALLKANPDAFVQDNMNRLKTGAVLNMPDPSLALSTPQPEARRIVLAQSRDFNAYRRKMAAAAPQTAVGSAAQKAQGTIETVLQDKKTDAEAQDKLTLSKNADVKAAPTAEDALSKQANEQEAANRAAELSKNINELNKLSAEAGAPVPAPAGQDSPTAKPETPAPAPAVTAPPPPAPAAEEEDPFKPHTLLDEVLTNPAIPAATAALLLLLTALGIYRMRLRQRQAAEPLSPAVLAEVAQPADEDETPPAMAPVFAPAPAPAAPPVVEEMAPEPVAEPEVPPEQDPAREVNLDPIAEADVYLAYGRADQAEQVLQKALADTPERMALHLKLLEIYMQQLDLGNFESTAREVQRLTEGQGEDWERACAMGISIDPDNPLYQPPGQAEAEPATELDLDLSGLPTEPLASDTEAQMADTAEALDELSLDDLTVTEVPDPVSTETAAGNIDELDAAAPVEPVTEEALDLAVPPDEIQPMGFDLSSLSLDLETPPSSEPAGDADPMEVKLALAEEFGVIGDTDGARSLLEEVIAEAQNEDVKARAEEALKKLR